MTISHRSDPTTRIARVGRMLPSLLIAVVLLTSGCAPVKPWQRETLSDPIMQPGRYPVAAAQLDHVYFSREAASGGTTVGGGGCGCN